MRTGATALRLEAVREALRGVLQRGDLQKGRRPSQLPGRPPPLPRTTAMAALTSYHNALEGTRYIRICISFSVVTYGILLRLRRALRRLKALSNGFQTPQKASQTE